MSVVGSNILAGASGAGGGAAGYTIERSLRFNSADSSYLNRTTTSAGNRRTWTWSGWLKRTKPGVQGVFFQASSPLTNSLYFNASDTLLWLMGGSTVHFQTSRVFRDTSAWMHLVLAVDTTQATQFDRIKVYINGVKLESSEYTTSPAATLNYDYSVNAASSDHRLGGITYGYSSCYLADVHLIDGQQLEASDFAEYDANNVWQPKAYSGTYGTNGFHLDFSDNTSTTTIAEDSSGNNNDFTANNFSVYTPQLLPGISLQNTNEKLVVPVSTDMQIETGDFTMEAWIYPKAFASLSSIFSRRRYGVVEGWFVNITSGKLSFHGSIDGVWYTWLTGSTTMNLNQWYHIAVTRDGNDVRVFLNGILDGSKTITTGINAAPASAQVAIGGMSYDLYQGTFNGYISNAHIVKGSALYTSNFTVPSAPLSSNVDTKLLCCQSDTSVTAAAVSPGTLTADATIFAGEFTDNSPSLDSLIDTPTNYTASSGNNGGNYCTLNPLDQSPSAGTVSDGNLNYAYPGSALRSGVRGTIGVSSGKWYWECTIIAINTSFETMIGVATQGFTYLAANNIAMIGNETRYYINDGTKQESFGTRTVTSYGASFTTGDVIGVALDLDAGTITFYKNGVSQGQAFSGLSGTYHPALITLAGGNLAMNFGQRPYQYTPPTNHLSICTENFPDPTIADGATAMDATLYTGNGSTQSITGLNFASAPDLVWIKNRSQADLHVLTDSVRGVTKQLSSSSNAAETTNADGLTAFNSDGFDLGADVAYNTNAESYVAWSWDGGTSTVTNTDGTHSAQVRANPSTGFSISTHSRTTAASISTWGHGLGAAPEFAILKPYNGAYNWFVWHKDMGNRKRIYLNSTSAGNSYAFDVWSSDSTTLGIYGTIIAGGGTALDCVTYAWAPIEGYSKFGFYEANGVVEGPPVFTGFTPKLIMTKDIDSTSNWNVYDTSRDTYNVADAKLSWNLASAESTLAAVDILSNGFKIRTNNADMNENARTFIYAAWAENPFKTARAR